MENNKETNFADEIENLYRIHYIAKKSDHEIQLNGISVKSFEPTKFYYAYSAFNAFYNFDWEESLESKKLVIISREEKEPSEQAKFKKMIKFILQDASDEEKGEFCKFICDGKKTEDLIEIISKITPDKYIKEEKIEKFKDTFENLIKTKKLVIISREEKEPSEQAKFKKMINFILDKAIDSEKEEFCEFICGGKKTEDLIEIFLKITPDKYIKQEKIKKFKDTFENLIKTKKINKKEFKENIVRFIYLVRNNVIHGTKDIIKMSDSCQKNRLEIYTNILLGLNELLFKILERDGIFKPLNEYRLENSKGSGSNDI